MAGPDENVVLADNPRGALVFKGNELRIVSKIADPAALRLDAPIGADGGGGGKLSFNALRDDGGEEELSFVIGRQMEAVRPDTHNYSGELVTFVRDGAVADADQAMTRVQEITATGGSGIAYSLPPVSITTPDGSPSRMTSPDGRYWLQMQDDGNVVLYDAADAAAPVAIADLWSLQARLVRLEGGR